MHVAPLLASFAALVGPRAPQITPGPGQVENRQGPIKLSGIPRTLVEQGNVTALRVTPDAQAILFLAPYEDAPVVGLHRVSPAGGSSPVALTDHAEPVSSFELSADGARVAYELGTFGSSHDLYVLPVDGSAPAVLLASSATDILEVRFGADGQWVVYTVAGTPLRLYAVRSDGSAPPVLLNPAAPSTSTIHRFELAAGGSRVVFDGDQSVDEENELFSVPVDGSSAPLRLNDPLPASGDVKTGEFRVAADGATVVFRADQLTNNVNELFSVPVDGSSGPVRLNAPLVAGGNVVSFDLGAAGTRAAFVADQSVDGVFDVYGVPIDASLAPTKLNGAETGADLLDVSPDGTRVAYAAVLAGDQQAFGAPLDGSAAAVQLSDLAPGSGKTFSRLDFTPDSAGVVYQVGLSFSPDLYYAPAAGGVPPTQLNTAPGTFGSFSAYRIGAGGLAYRHGISRLYFAPYDGSSPAFSVSPTPIPGAGIPTDFEVSSDASFVAFRGNLDVYGNTELYATDLGSQVAAGPLNGPLAPSPKGTIVSQLGLSPDGEWAVFSEEWSGLQTALYSVRIDDPASLRQLSIAGVTPAYRSGFAITPDSGRVVYRHGEFSGTYYSVPMDASGPSVQLSESLNEYEDSSALLEISPDGSRVTFREFRLYVGGVLTAPVDGSAGPTPLVPFYLSGGTETPARFTPDSTRIVFTTNADGDTTRLYVSPADGSLPAVQLAPDVSDPDMHQIGPFEVTPDSSRVVFRGDLDEVGRSELYVTPIGTNAPVRLSDVGIAAGDVTNGFLLTPDGSSALYVSDDLVDEQYELFVVPVDGSQAPLKLSGPMVAGGDVAWSSSGEPMFSVSPDGVWVVYVADQQVDERYDLWSAPLDGSQSAKKLNGAMVAAGDISGVMAGERHFAITPDSTRVVFLADKNVDSRFELYSAPIDGSGPIKKLNAPFTGNRDVEPGFAILDGSGLVLYRADQAALDVVELWLVPVDGSAPPRRRNGALIPLGDVEDGFGVRPGARHVLYRADAEHDGVIELYRFPVHPGDFQSAARQPR